MVSLRLFRQDEGFRRDVKCTGSVITLGSQQASAGGLTMIVLHLDVNLMICLY